MVVCLWILTCGTDPRTNSVSFGAIGISEDAATALTSSTESAKPVKFIIYSLFISQLYAIIKVMCQQTLKYIRKGFWQKFIDQIRSYSQKVF